MTTSGTVGATVIDVTTFIEHAVRRCGVPASIISAEIQQAARENMFTMFSAWANRGLSLWCVEKRVIPLSTARVRYSLPVGVFDILNALYRYGTLTAATSVGVDSAIITYAAATAVKSVLLTVGTTGTFTFIFETSTDNVNWTQVGSRTLLGVTAGDVVNIDADPEPTNLYWRVRQTTLTPANITAAQFMSNATEIPMAPLSRDDYTNLPNKNFQSLNPLQFWYDKQYLNPVLAVWPAPQDATRQAVLYVQQHIQDPGAYFNTVQIPQRWYEAAVYGLARVVFLELPPQITPPGRYEILVERADTTMREAEDSERDGAPVRWAPNISPYTR